MAIIKKDLNKILLPLILVPLILFVLFSIYYYKTLKDITLEYNKTVMQLKELTEQDIAKHVNRTYDEIEALKIDKLNLEQKYFEIRSANADLVSDNSMLIQDYSIAKAELEALQRKFEMLQSRYNEIESGLKASYEENSKLIVEKRGLCNKLAQNGISDERC